MKKVYKAPYFHPRFVSAISPLMVSRGQITETPDGFEGSLSGEEYDDAN